MNAGAPPRHDDLARFADIDAWVFDLDNTLYPASLNLFAQVDVRIRSFVERHLGLNPAEAQRVQKDYYRRYGTTLRGLIVEHGVEAQEFLAYVHDIDHSLIEPNPRLGEAIGKLPGRKFILTNGSRPHAERIAGRLGITRAFEDIFDIVRGELMPKPHREAYDLFLRETGVEAARGAMFEDLPRNLAVPHDLGMATVLIQPPQAFAPAGETWEQEGHDAAYVDFVADDLTAFLERIPAAATSR